MRNNNNIVLLKLPDLPVEADEVEVAEATPTAPASMTSAEDAVVMPNCCLDEPGISSAKKWKIFLFWAFVVVKWSA